MREKNFINQNKEKWSELERLLGEKQKDPDKLTRLFIQVTDDLSYARTFYPNRFVRKYLNGITQQLFYIIYRNRQEGRNRFILFWKEELPRLIYAARKELIFSFALFLISFLIGALSTAYDPEFPSLILGENYVQMTMENIKNGDPMAVYKKINQADMFMGISINNLWVSFLIFISGIVYCIGSIGLLMYNGIMVGTFQYFFYKHNLLLTSSLSIWLHGTLEMSSMIIATAAGITMGKGLIFPGTYSRYQSFFKSARRGIKILVGILPIIVLAAIIESFLTRYTSTPAVVKGGLIFISLGFILTYFVWYPIKKNKENSKDDFEESGLQPDSENNYDFNGVQSGGTMIGEVLVLYRDKGKIILRRSLVLAMSAAVVSYFLILNDYIPKYEITSPLIVLFNYPVLYFFYILHTIIFSFVVYYSLKIIAIKTDHSFKAGFGRYIVSFFFSALLLSFFFMDKLMIIGIVLIAGPLILQWLSIAFFQKRNLFNSLGYGFRLLNSNPGRAWGFYLMTLILGIMLYFLVDSPLFQLYKQIISWNFSLEYLSLQKIKFLLSFFVTYFALILIVPVIIFANALQYFSLREILEARGLTIKMNSLKKKEA